ncbi:MAG: TonB-dependent receptor [Opitutus sp.]
MSLKTSSRWLVGSLSWLLVGVFNADTSAQVPAVPLSPVFVTATRATEAVESVPFSHESVTGDALRGGPNVTIDGALRRIPGFSLFRRTDSLVANPTAQGVSLRGLGPSGASRSLVLLDGVPLNDPFGGWVLWTKVPRESLSSIEVVPGAGGTAWGNAALGGVIQLFTEPVFGSHERLAARYGSFDTTDLEAQVTEPAGPGVLQLLGRHLSTAGYYTVAPERRGPIDTPASSRSRWMTGRWHQALRSDLDATLTVRRFGERRGNGTPYQENASDETFASVSVSGGVSPTFHWNATGYAQRQDFSSTFSSVNATRTAETPASNQYAVPSNALGLAWVGEWLGSAGSRTSVGVDIRDVRGETREDSAFVNGAFTRRRFAGGRQTTGGIFALQSRSLTEHVRAAYGLRVDGWQDSNGHRRDWLNAAPVADQRFARQDGVALSPSAGVVWSVTDALRFHASAQHAFRRPTLNELYRPFRVGNVVTESNPALRTETVTSGEVGATLTRGPFELGATAFRNELHDAVANVTIARGPGTFPIVGTLPAGGEGRQRLNLDRSRVQGIAFSGAWKFTNTLTANVQYLINDATVEGAEVAPALNGLRLAQVPRSSASAGVTWKSGNWSIGPQVRFLGEQFEDDLNTLRLAAATVVDFSVNVSIGSHAELFLNGENIANHRIETGRSSDGLVNIGTPRLLLFGFRLWR